MAQQPEPVGAVPEDANTGAPFQVQSTTRAYRFAVHVNGLGYSYDLRDSSHASPTRASVEVS